MYECDRFDHCQFFLQLRPAMPQTLKVVQSLYCRSNYRQCARYQVGTALGTKAVPENLTPSDRLWADLLVEAASQSA